MIRFILKKSHGSCDYKAREDLYSIDIEVPELEIALRRGGYSKHNFEHHQLVGVELLEILEEVSE